MPIWGRRNPCRLHPAAFSQWYTLLDPTGERLRLLQLAAPTSGFRAGADGSFELRGRGGYPRFRHTI